MANKKVVVRKSKRPVSGYVRIMKRLFMELAPAGTVEFSWDRKEISRIAKKLGIPVPKNLGDNIYAIRHGRQDLPEEVLALTPEDKRWLLLPDGKGKYKFVQARASFFQPNLLLEPIKIPDATPQIVGKNALGDEQAVLARVRYNRLVDIFLSITASALQSHLRTSVVAVGADRILTTCAD